jgi:hypothetical protein
MYPNTFLRTFWQMDLRPQVFVAMPFSEAYKNRYESVIAPAIRKVQLGDKFLEPYRNGGQDLISPASQPASFHVSYQKTHETKAFRMPWGSRGRRFKSRRPDPDEKPCTRRAFRISHPRSSPSSLTRRLSPGVKRIYLSQIDL